MTSGIERAYRNERAEKIEQSDVNMGRLMRVFGKASRSVHYINVLLDRCDNEVEEKRLMIQLAVVQRRLYHIQEMIDEEERG